MNDPIAKLDAIAADAQPDVIAGARWLLERIPVNLMPTRGWPTPAGTVWLSWSLPGRSVEVEFNTPQEVVVTTSSASPGERPDSCILNIALNLDEIIDLIRSTLKESS